MPRQVRVALPILVVLALLALGIQIWASWRSTALVERVLSESEVPEGRVASEKAREELIGLRIKNRKEALFWSRLVSSLAPLATGLVAVVGAWLGLRNYLDTRNKERLDRAAADLKAMLDSLASHEPRQRAVGMVAMQHFLSQDKEEYHRRALAALVAAARLETDDEVLRSIRLAVQQAVANLSPNLLREASWQSVQLRRIDLSRRDLRGLDFLDANLEDAHLQQADLTGTRFRNARLNGADLYAATLEGADLVYADLAGARLGNARLSGAWLHHAKVLGMDVHGADLRGAHFNLDELPWEKVRNWRRARFDPDVRELLLDRYGPDTEGPAVLMLMWEIAPLIAGGTWTACYHLVRNLRRYGARVTVVVPWDETSILPMPFGCEVEVVPLGIRPSAGSTYGSAYDHSTWSTGSSYQLGSDSLGGTTLLRLVEEFRDRFVQFAQHRDFNLIHAHDWVTFSAAATVARERHCPWIAHLHSTELDRRPDSPETSIMKIEAVAAQADRVVAVSDLTARRVSEEYAIAAEKVETVPNSLSREILRRAESGRFDTRRIVFLGRLTLQKGPDLFVAIAEICRQRNLGMEFWVYGEGEEAVRLAHSAVSLRGLLDWSVRGQAFAGTSAVLVTSRSEPFGMVVLEAMMHRVPVLFPTYSGIAEQLPEGVGIRIDPQAPHAVADCLIDLLEDADRWEQVVQVQASALATYMDEQHDQRLLRLWRSETRTDRNKS